jgi:hypothetical protein
LTIELKVRLYLNVEYCCCCYCRRCRAFSVRTITDKSVPHYIAIEPLARNTAPHRIASGISSSSSSNDGEVSVVLGLDRQETKNASDTDCCCCGRRCSHLTVDDNSVDDGRQVRAIKDRSNGSTMASMTPLDLCIGCSTIPSLIHAPAK